MTPSALKADAGTSPPVPVLVVPDLAGVHWSVFRSSFGIRIP